MYIVGPSRPARHITLLIHMLTRQATSYVYDLLNCEAKVDGLTTVF